MIGDHHYVCGIFTVKHQSLSLHIYEVCWDLNHHSLLSLDVSKPGIIVNTNGRHPLSNLLTLNINIQRNLYDVPNRYLYCFIRGKYKTWNTGIVLLGFTLYTITTSPTQCSLNGVLRVLISLETCNTSGRFSEECNNIELYHRTNKMLQRKHVMLAWHNTGHHYTVIAVTQKQMA